MNTEELSNYIDDYLKNDKSHTAIMLNGEWGIGKSYYINEVLSKKIPCIIVSLYGLKDLFEVSKSLYVESRFKKFETKSEISEIGKVAAKTIAKSVFSFAGISLKLKEKDLKRVFKNLDLSNKLIVFEDIERTNIDIVEFFGYVNNLVERDKVKVLLVSNEKEIIKYEFIKDENEKYLENNLSSLVEESKEKKYTFKTEEYLKIKEKTVSDTILFEGNFKESIRSVISSFGDRYLNKVVNNSEGIDEIYFIFKNKECHNLRTLMFVCQKTINLYKRLNESQKENIEFARAIFFGMLNYSIDLKNGKKANWESEKSISLTLGSRKYPLFKFCYDYIKNQNIEINNIEIAEKELKNYYLYKSDQSLYDPDLQIIRNFYVQKESDVVRSLNNLTKHLEDESYFSFKVYGKIAISLVRIHHYLECDIERAEELLIKNLKNKGDLLDLDFLFDDFDFIEKENLLIKEAERLKKQMETSLKLRDNSIFNFDYRPESISDFYSLIVKNEGKILHEGFFVGRLNSDKIIEMLKKCNAQQMNNFRGAFLAIYRPVNIKDYLSGDKKYIEELLDKVIYIQDFEEFDRVQKLQIKYFCENLQDFKKKL